MSDTATPPQPLLQVRDLRVSYTGGKEILKGIEIGRAHV